MATPYALVSLRETTSTQDDARRLYDGKPVLVVARSQRAGRGRTGKQWLNAPSAAAVSLALRPSWQERDWPRLTLAAGVAAVEALGTDATLKWPNDVMRGRAKLGGILTEVADGLAVVGWGCNLWWPEPPSGMGAAFDEPVNDDMVAEIAKAWAERLLTIAQRPSSAWPLDAYRALCSTIGQPITWEPHGQGTAVDVGSNGALLVETADGPIGISAGAVSEVRTDPV